MIGLGASAISLFPDAIIQNEKSPGGYRDRIAHAQLAGARGVRRSAEDQQRGLIIEQLLCQAHAEPKAGMFDAELEARLSPFISLGLVERCGHRLRLTDRGRPYARNVAAAFDRHSAL